jgi:hypothetical protein
MHYWLVSLACSLLHLLAVVARPTEPNQVPLSVEANGYQTEAQTAQTVQAWRFNTTGPSAAKELLRLAEVWASDANALYESACLPCRGSDI